MAFEWIFFDCFNTLIDDFDQTGEELALLPVYALPAEVGLYDSAAEFRRDYHAWRNRQWQAEHREIEMGKRYQAVLQEKASSLSVAETEKIATEMVDRFRVCYQQSLRLTDGVQEMLEFWQGRVRLGVVSNFYIQGWPTELLESFGLRSYFDFVVDSAEYGWRKPGPQIYDIACNLAQVVRSDRHKILFVGDHLLNDVLAPQDLGMQGLFFDRSQVRPAYAPPTEGVRTITDWNQFRADFCSKQEH